MNDQILLRVWSLSLCLRRLYKSSKNRDVAYLPVGCLLRYYSLKELLCEVDTDFSDTPTMKASGSQSVLCVIAALLIVGFAAPPCKGSPSSKSVDVSTDEGFDWEGYGWVKAQEAEPNLREQPTVCVSIEMKCDRALPAAHFSTPSFFDCL